jgi:hypothetical protein
MWFHMNLNISFSIKVYKANSRYCSFVIIMYHYIHCNIDVKYLQSVIDVGVKDVSIKSVNDSLSFDLGLCLIH